MRGKILNRVGQQRRAAQPRACGGEREQHQKLVGEASAFKAINASQRAQLDELMRVALAPPPAAKKRAASVVAKPAPTPAESATEGKKPTP